MLMCLSEWLSWEMGGREVPLMVFPQPILLLPAGGLQREEGRVGGCVVLASWELASMCVFAMCLYEWLNCGREMPGAPMALPRPVLCFLGACACIYERIIKGN